MALYYLETSALVKLYVRERGSERMLGLATGSEAHLFAILAVAQVEFHSAVRRRQRDSSGMRTTRLRLEPKLTREEIRKLEARAAPASKGLS